MPRSFAAFLSAARSALAAPAGQRPTPLTFVVGNESADLDSLCSALLLAYFRSHTPPHHVLHIPLSNLARADLRLRPELHAALAGGMPGAGSGNNSGSGSGGADEVALESLLTLSDLPADLTAADSRWILVDHNALTGDLATRFAASVVGCIDHHVDEGVVPTAATTTTTESLPPPRIIERCGSCASLVVEHSRDAWRALAANSPDAATDRVLARLALAPILVDTANLQSASKTTDVDRQAVAVAESFLQPGGDGSSRSVDVSAGDGRAYDRTQFYNELSRRKNDIAGLTYDELLRKDYKQWREGNVHSGLTLGMATVVQGMGYLLAHTGDQDALLTSLRAFARQRQLDLVAVMTVQHDEEGGFGRQLLLWAFTPRAVRAAQTFAAAQQAMLGLASWEDGRLDDNTDGGAEEWRTCWQQTRTEYSRKQVAPYLREAMRSVLR
ncbi:exopolyphosphatase [Niveomyces insectorum RCEF 264]|uniref:Exopolyphosphatase n=1 Tax=Niveomyces insectorum RCEF 264 TaxID=1081102 RepID=A0A167YPS7_9HYPO|nr:exopolyphosphatase [Niveomyces insectorum RCEF 264]